uniref:Uncharacterized protein n=1 Tax=Cacopsylla melanoneura TaxID=428564 RepID=A0A8D8RI71_9HEMI
MSSFPSTENEMCNAPVKNLAKGPDLHLQLAVCEAGLEKTRFFLNKKKTGFFGLNQIFRFFWFFYKLFSISWICHFNFGKKGYFSFPGNSTISFKIKMVYLLTKRVYNNFKLMQFAVFLFKAFKKNLIKMFKVLTKQIKC